MKTKKLLWGVFFIAAAILIVVNQLGYFMGINLWGLLFTVLVVPVVVSGLYRRNFFNVFFGIAIWLIVFARPLGITPLVPWTVLFAALFLSIGFSILVKPRYRFGNHHHLGRSWMEHNHNYTEYETVDYVDGNEVNCCVSLGGSCKYLHSDSLEKGRLECSLGYLKVYFDNVQLHPDGTAIFVDCSLGSMELYLPRDWQVIINVDSMLGNISEQHHMNSGNGPVLTITGYVKMGNIDIKYI